jgi:hypothetical protein
MKIPARLAYRVRQFRLAFLPPRQNLPDDLLAPHLSPALINLFHRMTPAEQAHSFAVLQRLQTGGEEDPALLAAALLHDVGKVLSPLSVFDRVMIVLGKRFFHRAFTRHGNGPARGVWRPFVVAAQHPAWGAQLVIEAGASPRTVELVRRHQEASPGEDAGLRALQQADDHE